MTKTNRFTLIATFLLGILLYTVLRFADNFPAPPMADTVRETATTRADPEPIAAENAAPEIAPDLLNRIPSVRTYDELVSYLDARGLNGRMTAADSAEWYAKRGYLGQNALLGITADSAPVTYYNTLDEATLIALGKTGDAGATQMLAQRSMFLDPFRGLELYKKAITQGSLYAIIKVSDTLDSFTGAYLSDFSQDPALRKKMLGVRSQGYGRNLRMATHATAVAALRDGGPPIADDNLLNWISTIEAKMTKISIPSGCKWAEEKQVGHGRRRRMQGGPAVFTEPPAVFLSQPDLEALLPCADTEHPVSFTMDLSACQSEPVIGPDGNEWLLYVCA